MELLATVKEIKSKYDTIAKFTAANFNVFEILDVGTREVRLHSSFLAELLDPKGSHMQGDLFLKIFLKEVVKWDTVFDTENASVQKEFGTGRIDNDYTQGGNIDIIIRNKEKAIIIENKIYAGDQEKQLIRYYDYGMKVFNSKENFKVLYLTLDGSGPSENSKGNIEYSSISYKSDIVKWLEECLTVVYDFPLVFALIRQYLNHVKYLTNQSIFNKMENEIQDKIKENLDTFLAARKISLAIANIREDLCSKIGSHFTRYFERTETKKFITNSKYQIEIILQKDSTDDHFVAFSVDTKLHEDADIENLRNIGETSGGSKGNHNYITWYSIPNMPYNLDRFTDEEVFKLLSTDNLNDKYKEIDSEIKGFIDRFTSHLNN
jgi:hypothetical protein